ncbi:MAG TPA: aldolase/citrate lyase family protein [Gaiellaceae bacterium]|nr:aldolase/citrate lyase family protein [Gaiellaceae bacterium]
MNRVRRLVADGQPANGTFVYSPDPAVVELIGAAGFDFVVVDTEHASLGRREVENLIRAADGKGMSALVRVNRIEDVAATLDAGAAGIVAPRFGADAASRELAASLRYPPAGTRGACTCSRSVDYGIQDLASVAAAADEEVWLLGLIEDRAAVEALDDVLAVPGLDAVMPGRSDLAASYGVPGRLDDPRVTAAVEQILDAAAARPGIAAVVYATDAEDAQRWRRRGAQVVVCSIDYKILARAYAAIARELKAAT